MSVNVIRMRETFAHAAERMGWTLADVAEFNADIKAALAKSDKPRQEWWMDFLERASNLTSLAAQCRAMEARIKAAAEERNRMAA